LIFFFSMNWVASNPFTSPAKREGKAAASNNVMLSMPDLPSTAARHASFVPIPFGTTNPIPVMTTRSI